MKAHDPAARAPRPVFLPEAARPDAPGRPQLGNLLEEVVVDVPEEREARREFVDVEPARQAPLHVGEPVGQREGQLLGGGGPRLADVIARNRHRVPLRRVLRPPLEAVDDEAQRGLDGKAPRVLRHVLLEDVILDRAAQLFGRHALLLGGGDVEAPQDDRRPVDGHRGRHLVERDAVEQHLHVGQRTDGHAALAHLALRPGVVGVVAHQGGEIEGDGETRGSVPEQELVAPVGLVRRPESGELAHRPQLAAVSRGMDAAGERKRPRHLERRAGGALEVERRVERRHLVRRVGPGEVANLGPVVAFLPRGDFGAELRQLGAHLVQGRVEVGGA